LFIPFFQCRWHLRAVTRRNGRCGSPGPVGDCGRNSGRPAAGS
jgi:hypothetical protein